MSRIKNENHRITETAGLRKETVTAITEYQDKVEKLTGVRPRLGDVANRAIALGIESLGAPLQRQGKKVAK